MGKSNKALDLTEAEAGLFINVALDSSKRLCSKEFYFAVGELQRYGSCIGEGKKF